MAKQFQINILTPDKTIYIGKSISLIVPAQLGYLGVLADHAPLMANIVSGKITCRQDSQSQTVVYSKGKGFLEVLNNHVTLLLEDASTNP